MITDSEILSIVNEAIETANKDGDNWADYVDSALTDAGVDLATDQPDGSDPWEIATLADGRTIRLSDESARGAARYRIADAE